MGICSSSVLISLVADADQATRDIAQEVLVRADAADVWAIAASDCGTTCEFGNAGLLWHLSVTTTSST
jgi:hypothetical protein